MFVAKPVVLLLVALLASTSTHSLLIVAYVGGLGPFNYKLEEVERWLEARAP